ncbi:Tyrosine recombinase XerC [bioreactor metagenome]|uniref:Tyrosine recombinase XerC n=1 Tax=bioreactor metagenome TaxID=1076179 RepID=A0A644XX62_9ZZZZ
MARTTSSRNAQGAGNIRKITVERGGKKYTYWQGRYTTGRDPGTGKQVQKSISGKTQKEVREKLQAVSVDLTRGTYTEPDKMTVSQWCDIWLKEYVTGSVKPFTLASYTAQVENHIKPGLGSLKLSALNTAEIQRFYNVLKETANGAKGRKGKLSPKTIKNIHGVLHKALDKAVALRYIPFNPSGPCELPRSEKKEIHPLEGDEIKTFLSEISTSRFKNLFTVILFTGLREGEALGLQWSRVDFKAGTILIDKQLQKEKKKGGVYSLAETKNSKGRLITAAPSVMAALKAEKVAQAERQLKAGTLWANKNNLVFTDELGNNLVIGTMYKAFKRIASKISRPDARVHDLRHTFAVMSLQEGDSVKTVQGNLGHATASFTLDVYGHVSEKMKTESAARMEALIQSMKKA